MVESYSTTCAETVLSGTRRADCRGVTGRVPITSNETRRPVGFGDQGSGVDLQA